MGTPEALLPLTAGNQRPSLAPGGSPSGEPRQQAGLTEVPSASAQSCESLCAPRWRRTEQGWGWGWGGRRTLSQDLGTAASQHSGEGLPVKAVSLSSSVILRCGVPQPLFQAGAVLATKKASCGRGSACGWAALWATGSLFYTWSCPS